MTLVSVAPTISRRKPGIIDGFDRLFEEIFNKDLTLAAGKAIKSRPAVNVKETADHYYLEIAAPGLEKKDFQINIEEGKLNISVEKEQTEEKEANKYLHREFAFFSFKRSFEIPEKVNVEGISGVYNNGILVVALPKMEEVVEKPRVVEIQ